MGVETPPLADSHRVRDEAAYADGDLAALSIEAAPWLVALASPKGADAFFARTRRDSVDDLDDGIVLLHHRRWREARAAFERVKTLEDAALANQLEAYRGISLVETGDQTAAMPHLETFLYTNVVVGHAHEFLVGHASFALARALAATGGDKVRARRLAELAQRKFTPYQLREREAVAAWLAAHPP